MYLKILYSIFSNYPNLKKKKIVKINFQIQYKDLPYEITIMCIMKKYIYYIYTTRYGYENNLIPN